MSNFKKVAFATPTGNYKNLVTNKKSFTNRTYQGFKYSRFEMNHTFFQSFVNSRDRKDRILSIVFSADSFLKSLYKDLTIDLGTDVHRALVKIMSVMILDGIQPKRNIIDLNRMLRDTIEKHPRIFKYHGKLDFIIPKIKKEEVFEELEESNIFAECQDFADIVEYNNIEYHEDLETESRKHAYKFI